MGAPTAVPAVLVGTAPPEIAVFEPFAAVDFAVDSPADSAPEADSEIVACGYKWTMLAAPGCRVESAERWPTY